MRNLDPERARWIRVRMGVLSGLMGVGLGVVLSAAYRVQVEDSAAWKATAQKQREQRLHVEPSRGSIVDRSGSPLAVTLQVPSVSVDVVELLHGLPTGQNEEMFLRDASGRIAAALSLDPAEVLSKLQSKRRFVWLKRRVSSEEADAVKELGDRKQGATALRGVVVDGEAKRFYPGRELAASTIGFVGPDGQGKEGLELSLDEELHGHMEDVKGLRDRAGRLVFSEGTAEQQAPEGYRIELTIDEGMQHMVERELDAARRTYETKGASVVVLDPRTGEILALASSPGYNPNDYHLWTSHPVDAGEGGFHDFEFDRDALRNRAVGDRFEPGSVMKVFTVATALASGTLKANDTIDCEHGAYRFDGVTVHDSHPNDVLSVTQVLAKSSNIGALKIGLGLGEANLYAGLRKFGFGEATGLPLPGEATGVLRPRGRPWVPVETATASYGQGITVSTIQLAMAMGAIANSGKLMEPTLVRRVISSTGEVIREAAPRVRREAVPPGVAHTVAEMLTAVAEDGGTAVSAAVAGFRVAGKTGTAQKADPSNGRYSMDRFNTSFVGFLPVEAPRLVIAVVLDEPMIGHYGGDLAGPVFRRIAEQSLESLGVSSQRPKSGLLAGLAPPPLPTDRVQARVPLANPPREGDLVPVPNVVGSTAHDAVVGLMGLGFLADMEGSGTTMRTVPPAGTMVPKGTTVRIFLDPGS